MTSKVNMHEAKTQLSRLVERALAGEDVVIARHGRGLVRLVPLEAPGSALRPIGLHAGRLTGANADFEAESLRPLDEAELGSWHG